MHWPPRCGADLPSCSVARTVRARCLSSGVPEPSQPELPVARVAVDIPLSHLDRPFDYAVTAEQDAEAVPGARVRVRFAGRLRDGFILDRVADR